MEQIAKILENLNDRQLEAVKSTEGYIRVIAGAGSGKTKTLTSRYGYIVEALGISSSNILCVTFTNKAAKEMQNRVKKLIGQNADLSFITTYHGFCVRVLREDINAVKYPRTFVIMDVEDQKSLLNQIFTELELTQKDFRYKQVLANISYRKGDLNYMDYILTGNKPEAKKTLDKIFYAYLTKQQKNFALDFDDLINFTIQIFKTEPEILNKWQKRIHYIQVDETQDSSNRQFGLVADLSDYHKNLFVVGDPDQTIYEWRGAVPEILVDFDKTFSDSQTIIMNQNYRSTSNILSVGNNIIKNNKIRVHKDMFTKNETGLQVVHFHGRNEIEESRWVIKEIKNIIKKEKAKLSDITILYRAHHISRNFEQALIKEDIPYNVFGGIRFFERKEIKDILAYLRLIAIGDDLSFSRVYNTPKRGLGKKYYENLSTVANRQNLSLYETLKSNIESSSLNKKGAQDFIGLIESLKEKQKNLYTSDLVKLILDETGLSKLYRDDGDEERLENVQELVNSIMYLEEENEERINLTDYLQEIALYTNRDFKDDEEGRVNLMTIHTAKGLEYPYVFLVGFIDGILPSAMSLKERRLRALEEERRLVYVAITRAEKRFYMTESEGFNFSLGEQKLPSRFLFEIDENLYVKKGKMDKKTFNEAKKLLAVGNEELKDISFFDIGDIVEHPVWNKGKIISVNKAKGEYEIWFIDSGKVKPITFEYKFLKKSII